MLMSKFPMKVRLKVASAAWWRDNDDDGGGGMIMLENMRDLLIRLIVRCRMPTISGFSKPNYFISLIREKYLIHKIKFTAANYKLPTFTRMIIKESIERYSRRHTYTHIWWTSIHTPLHTHHHQQNKNWKCIEQPRK